MRRAHNLGADCEEVLDELHRFDVRHRAQHRAAERRRHGLAGAAAFSSHCDIPISRNNALAAVKC
jgi:hypothetical protein